MLQETYASEDFHATHGIFSIYDAKAQAWLQPFFMPNAGTAIRAFVHAAQEPTHQFHVFAEDYTLFQIGEWDEQRGLIAQLESKIPLGTALEHLATTPEAVTKHRQHSQQGPGEAIADIERENAKQRFNLTEKE